MFFVILVGGIIGLSVLLFFIMRRPNRQNDTENDTTSPGGSFLLDLQIQGKPSAELQEAAAQSKNIMEAAVLHAPANFPDKLDISISEKNLGDGVLGVAYKGSDGTNYVEVGTSVRQSSIFFNGKNYLAYVSVLLHEIFHILGIVCVSASAREYCNQNTLKYTGKNGVKQMNALRKSCGHDEKPFVLLENDGGSGTAGVHVEEDEYRILLMTGYLNLSNFLSRVELGMLEDIGFQVNYNAAAPDKDVCAAR